MVAAGFPISACVLDGDTCRAINSRRNPCSQTRQCYLRHATRSIVRSSIVPDHGWHERVRIQINADTPAVKHQVEQLSRFYLTGIQGQLESAELTVDDILDPLGQALTRCRFHGQLGLGDSLEVTEVQADLALAVTRTLDRAARTARLRSVMHRPARTA